MSSSISYKNYISFPLNKINVNLPEILHIKNKIVNFNNYPEYIKYLKHINTETLWLLNTTNPLNIINFFTYSKYYKIETSNFPFLSYISDFYSYEYKDITPSANYTVINSSLSITDKHRFKSLNFKPFSEISLKNPTPYLISKGTSLKKLHRHLLFLNERLNFNLQSIYNLSPKQKQLLIKLNNYNTSKLL